jgi:hypothetical protein
MNKKYIDTYTFICYWLLLYLTTYLTIKGYYTNTPCLLAILPSYILIKYYWSH